MANALYPEQIVVKTAVVDGTGTFGPRLKITDINDKPYSISVKHQDLWPVFQNNIGKPVSLKWSIPVPGQTWKAFVSEASVITTPQPSAQPAPQNPQPISSPVTPPVVSNPQPASREASIEMQVALKCLTELGVAKLLDIVTYDALVARLSKMAGLEIEEVKPAKAVKG
jgi:hypothetical protein